MEKIKLVTLATLACLTFLSPTSVWATPDLEPIGTEQQGINGPVYLITDSVSALHEQAGMFQATIVTDTHYSLTKDRGLTINCNQRTLRVDWLQPSQPPISSMNMRVALSSKFDVPAKGSAYELVVNRVCDQE